MSKKKSSCAGSQGLLLTAHNLAANPSSFSACDNAWEACCVVQRALVLIVGCYRLPRWLPARHSCTHQVHSQLFSSRLLRPESSAEDLTGSIAISSYKYNTPVLLRKGRGAGMSCITKKYIFGRSSTGIFSKGSRSSGCASLLQERYNN